MAMTHEIILFVGCYTIVRWFTIAIQTIRRPRGKRTLDYYMRPK